MLVSEHLNLLLALCHVTLKLLSWYCSITLLTPCGIISFPLNSVLSMLIILILHIFELIKGMPFIKRKSHYRVKSLWNWIIGAFNGTRIILTFDNPTSFPWIYSALEISSTVTLLFFKLSWIYNILEFGGVSPSYTGWGVHSHVFYFDFDIYKVALVMFDGK